MPQRCTVCAHPETKQIEHEIVHGKAHTTIADTHGLDSQAVRRHGNKHLPAKLTKAVEKESQAHTENILDGVHDLLNRTKSILAQADEQGQKRTALKAIREARSTYELLSKIAVKLREYQQEEQQKQSAQTEQTLKEGFKGLTDQELHAFLKLSAKVHQNDPDQVLDHETRQIVQHINGLNAPGPEGYGGPRTVGPDEDVAQQAPANKGQNGPSQDKNTKALSRTKAPEDDLQLDDLQLDDLQLDDDELDSFEPHVPDNPKKNIIPGGD